MTPAALTSPTTPAPARSDTSLNTRSEQYLGIWRGHCEAFPPQRAGNCLPGGSQRVPLGLTASWDQRTTALLPTPAVTPVSPDSHAHSVFTVNKADSLPLA